MDTFMNASSTTSSSSMDRTLQRPKSTIKCIRYQTGFCPHGSNCLFTHTKQHGSPPPEIDMVRFVPDASRSAEQQLPRAEPSQQYQAVSKASPQSYHDNVGQPGQPGFAVDGEQVQETHHGLPSFIRGILGLQQVQQTHQDMPRAVGGQGQQTHNRWRTGTANFIAGHQQGQQTHNRCPRAVGRNYVVGPQQVQQTHHDMPGGGNFDAGYQQVPQSHHDMPVGADLVTGHQQVQKTHHGMVMPRGVGDENNSDNRASKEDSGSSSKHTFQNMTLLSSSHNQAGSNWAPMVSRCRYRSRFCPVGPNCLFNYTKPPPKIDMVRFVPDSNRFAQQQLPRAEPSQQHQAVSEASPQSYHDNMGQPGQPGLQQTHHCMPRAGGGDLVARHQTHYDMPVGGNFDAGHQQVPQTHHGMPEGGDLVAGHQQVQETHHGMGMPRGVGDENNIDNRASKEDSGSSSKPTFQNMALLSSSHNQASSNRAPLAGRCRYFVMRTNSRDNLRSAAESGWWKAHQNIIDTLNNAFRECDHVILFFSTNKARHFEGCAKMVSIIGDHDRGSSSNNIRPVNNIGENLQIKWFKLCVLPLTKIEGPTNISSVQNSKDGQELDESVGEKIFSLFLQEPDGDLMRLAKNRTNIGVGRDQQILLYSFRA